MSHPKHHAQTLAPPPDAAPHLAPDTTGHGGLLAFSLIPIAVAAYLFGPPIWRKFSESRSERREAEKKRKREQARLEFYDNNPPFLRKGQAALYRNYTRDIEFQRPRSVTFGDGRIAGLSEVAASGGFADNGYPLGQAFDFGIEDKDYEWGGWMRYGGDSHMMTVAPTGGGKFTTNLAPYLLNPEDFSCALIVDTKAQASCVSYSVSNSEGREAVYLNPFYLQADTLGKPTSYNPLTALDPTSIGYAADCDGMSDAIVWSDGTAEYFVDSAKTLISGAIYYVRKYRPASEANLVTVRALIASPSSVFKTFIQEALDTGDELLIERLARFANLSPDDRETKGVINTAITQTAFISNDAIRNSLRGEGSPVSGDGFIIPGKEEPFTFNWLRRKKGRRVFLVLPPDKMSTCAKWFRLVVASAMRELMQDISGEVVRLILDEVAQMGNLKILEQNVSIARGYKMPMHLFWQDLNQIKAIYKDAWLSFLANSAVKVFYAPADLFTATELEKMCGQTTIVVVNKSSSTSKNEISTEQRGRGFTGQSSGENTSETLQGAPVFLAQDIMGLKPNLQLMFIAGVKHPIICGRSVYWEIGVLNGRADPDPYHKPANNNAAEPAQEKAA